MQPMSQGLLAAVCADRATGVGVSNQHMYAGDIGATEYKGHRASDSFAREDPGVSCRV